MHPLNWAVVIGWLAYVAIDGLRRARGTKHLEGYLLVKPGGSPPAIHSPLFGAALVRLEPIGGGWYRFVTT